MNIRTDCTLILATNDAKQAVIALLQENSLPVSDLDEGKQLFALIHNNEICGTGGLEFYNSCALLRSVSVRKDLQGKGFGKYINRELERISKQRGVDHLYLLTTTAKDFFEKEGYQVMKRDEAPGPIKNTSEFSTVCASTAVLMRKELL